MTSNVTSNTSFVPISIEKKNFVIFNVNYWIKNSAIKSRFRYTNHVSRLLMFKGIRYSLLLLEACHSFCLNNWGLLKDPGFRLISPESSSNKGQNELSFLNRKFRYCKNAQFTLEVWGINFICYFDGVMGKKLTSKTRFESIMKFWKSITNTH